MHDEVREVMPTVMPTYYYLIFKFKGISEIPARSSIRIHRQLVFRYGTVQGKKKSRDGAGF
jgi:hypothetical protein